MNCFDCFRPKTSSPVRNESKSAPVTSEARSPLSVPQQTAVGLEKPGLGPARKPRSNYASLDEVLKSEKAMEALRQYMVTIRQDHLLDFLADVELYRRQRDEADRLKLSQQIFTTYLKVLAEREVVLDKPLRDSISARLQEAPATLFDRAERAVTDDIRRDVFPHFLKTPLFERLAGLA
ncbi:regulator of G-protein signaling 13-like isoform X1 [Pollicipes pollicipes]|uniref:regulator of G-protein signaling 13-like n=1 Tax=Pollicipes pollicipes TaxID=41117 RepID=UPI001884EA74|nr:regulator of G-protein signaling 13-like [Pollicipes pollicipes]XP_037074859.1 regulator of G-protein signaling 13-like isoform X1 [Pollicipes pollicipes]